MDAVVSAVYGGYDPFLSPAPEIPDIPFVCFTDDPDLDAPGWDVRVVDRPEEHPRMRAKWFKIMTHLALPEADRTLWIDGSHRILPGLPVRSILGFAERTGIAAHSHPRRCIYPEAVASMDFPKYRDLRPSTVEQAEAYRRDGHPENWGLWACGSLARKRSPEMDAAMEDWWAECVRWTYQDQVSFPVVMRRHGIEVETFPFPQYGSPWFSIGGHMRDD